jgi:predicted nucleotidyltransferase
MADKSLVGQACPEDCLTKTLKEFRQEIEKLYGKRLKDVILYGSWARGEAKEESDIDLLVVLKGEVKPCKEIDRMIDIITEINLKYGVLLSIFPVSEEEYSTVNSPLLINVRKEGMPA